MGQGKGSSTIEIAGYCNLKIFGGEWNLKVCHLASSSRRENFKKNWEKEIFSKGLGWGKEHLMQERGEVVQDESGSSCGETRLWNKHFWKRSKLEKNKSCVHGVRLTSFMVWKGTGKICINAEFDEVWRTSLHYVWRYLWSLKTTVSFTSLWLLCHLDRLCQSTRTHQENGINHKKR